MMETKRTDEQVRAILGVEGRAYAVIGSYSNNGTLANQTWKASREYKEGGSRMRMVVKLRFDDECKNGHNSFAITCATYEALRRGASSNTGWRDVGGGAAHEEIANVFPELAPLIKWHLTSSDGPLHYIANTLYHASNRDHNGLLKGEKRQKVARGGKFMWELSAELPDGALVKVPDKHLGMREVPVYAVETLHVGDAPPATPVLKWGPCMEVGEGKERQLEYARSSAVWPEATDEQLMSEPAVLKQMLLDRHPALMEEFKKAMVEVCGFEWEAT